MKNPILLTGFEPFNQWNVNSSWEAVRQVQAQLPADVHAVRLPVEHLKARQLLYQELKQVRPSACLCVGLGPEDAFQIEKLARKPVAFESIDGPEILRGAWPWEEMTAAFGQTNLPMRISEDAGQYVCESTYWALLSFRAAMGFPMYAAFLHVPPLSESFPLEKIAVPIYNITMARISAFKDEQRTRAGGVWQWTAQKVDALLNKWRGAN